VLPVVVVMQSLLTFHESSRLSRGGSGGSETWRLDEIPRIGLVKGVSSVPSATSGLPRMSLIILIIPRLGALVSTSNGKLELGLGCPSEWTKGRVTGAGERQ
jgi:hypothetical protein